MLVFVQKGLNFGPTFFSVLNTEERIKKTQTAFYMCRSIIAKKWGLSPKLTLWILNAIVRPILTYGSCVWWPVLSLQMTRAAFDRVFRSVCLGITGALKSTPTDALFTIIGVTSLTSCVKTTAPRTAIILSSVELWTNKYYGHTKILDDVMIFIKRKIDDCGSIFKFAKNFKCLFPKRSQCRNNRVTSGYD